MCSVHYVVYKKELTYAYEVLDVLSAKLHKLQAAEKKVLDFIKKDFPISVSSGNGKDEHSLVE